MKNFFVGLVVGVALTTAGIALVILNWGGEIETVQDTPPASSTLERLEGKLEAFELRAEDIREELAAAGRVVRQRASELGEAVADQAADLRVTGSIKARLARDPELSAWEIGVSTTDGRVTLSGRVDSVEKVGRAMLLALETDGVRSVISVLEVEGGERSGPGGAGGGPDVGTGTRTERTSEGLRY